MLKDGQRAGFVSVTSYVSPAGGLSLFSREVNVLGLGALSKDLTPL